VDVRSAPALVLVEKGQHLHDGVMTEVAVMPAWTAMTPAQVERWDELLSGLIAVLGAGPRLVVVDGHHHAALFAERIADGLAAIGQRCVRLSGRTPLADEDAWRLEGAHDVVAIADGATWRRHPPGPAWDVVIWLRTPSDERSQADADANVVVDLYDPAWPVIRYIDPGLVDRHSWYIAETRAFFAVRAATWDVKFGDDLPAYAEAVAQAGIPRGGVVVDAGCGTGRALPALRDAVGPTGTVIGVDITPPMLTAARSHGRGDSAHLVLADARHLPFPDASVDAVFAAGLVAHLPDVEGGLEELARVTVDDGRLALFHPSGRVALAARHGRTLRDDEPLSEDRLRFSLQATGWSLSVYDDPTNRFFALATRTPR